MRGNVDLTRKPQQIGQGLDGGDDVKDDERRG